MKRTFSKGNVNEHSIHNYKHYIRKTKGRANSTDYTNNILSNAYINRRNERMQIRDFSFNSFVTNIKKKVVDQPGIKVITKIFNPDFPNEKHFLSHLSTTAKQQPITCEDGTLLRNSNNEGCYVYDTHNHEQEKNYDKMNDKQIEDENKVNEVINYHTHRILQALSFTKSKREYDKIYIRNKYARLFME